MCDAARHRFPDPATVASVVTATPGRDQLRRELAAADQQAAALRDRLRDGVCSEHMPGVQQTLASVDAHRHHLEQRIAAASRDPRHAHPVHRAAAS